MYNYTKVYCDYAVLVAKLILSSRGTKWTKDLDLILFLRFFVLRGGLRMTILSFLVPKLYLGMHLLDKFYLISSNKVWISIVFPNSVWEQVGKPLIRRAIYYSRHHFDFLVYRKVFPLPTYDNSSLESVDLTIKKHLLPSGSKTVMYFPLGLVFESGFARHESPIANLKVSVFSLSYISSHKLLVILIEDFESSSESRDPQGLYLFVLFVLCFLSLWLYLLL